MAFRLKVTKTNGREYAAIVENIYSSSVTALLQEQFALTAI